MCAAYGNQLPAGHRPSQRLCATGDSDAKLARTLQLRMVASDCRCDDHLACARNVCRVMTLEQLDRQHPQIVGGAEIHVAAAHRIPASDKKLGEGTHSRAGNSDEVNWTTVGRPAVSHRRVLLQRVEWNAPSLSNLL